MSEPSGDRVRQPSLALALSPIALLTALLAANIALMGDSAIEGPNQVALLIAAAFAALIAIRRGYRWADLQHSMIESIGIAMPAILILLVVGSLAGAWLIGGIVPSLVYFGLVLLDPSIFLVACCISCALTSLAAGSSWTTSATLGIALMGIGQAMGLPLHWVAGAIISGAYFGDKLSPLSDTTNLASAVSGSELFSHIRYLSLTTVPSLAISLLIFAVIGWQLPVSNDGPSVAETLTVLEQTVNISGWTLLVPAAVIALILKRVPALPALTAGTVLGLVSALLLQQELLATLSNANASPVYSVMFQALSGDIGLSTGDAALDKLLSSGGMAGMLNTVWLIMCAMVFGGVMHGSDALARISAALLSRVKSDASLIQTTGATCIFSNCAAPDQYLSIAVPGQMYKPVYRERGLAPENLSRTLEDTGTVTGVLIPWNTCGAYHAGVLGIATMSYAPFALFCLISPVMTLIFAHFNIRIARLPAQGQTEALTAKTA